MLELLDVLSETLPGVRDVWQSWREAIHSRGRREPMPSSSTTPSTPTPIALHRDALIAAATAGIKSQIGKPRRPTRVSRPNPNAPPLPTSRLSPGLCALHGRCLMNTECVTFFQCTGVPNNIEKDRATRLQITNAECSIAEGCALDPNCSFFSMCKQEEED